MEEKQTIFQRIMGVVNRIGNVILLNLLFLVSCLPLVTLGAATSGLYGAARFKLRGDSSFRGYREGFRKHFLRTTLAGAACLGLGFFALNNVIISIDILLADPSLVNLSSVLQTAIHVLFFGAVVMLGTALFPINVYFENDTAGWLADAWYLVGHGFFPVLLTAVLLWAPVAILLCFPLVGFMLLLVFLAVYYSVVSIVASVLLKNTLIQIADRHQIPISPQ